MERISGLNTAYATVTNMVYGAGYLYYLDGVPSEYLVRVNPQTMQIANTTFISGSTTAYALDCDSTYVYSAYQSLAYIHKFNLDTTVNLNIGSGSVLARTIKEYGDHVYVGYNTAAAKIQKRNKSNLSIVTTLTLNSGENYCYALACDGTYMYAGLNTSPAKIIKIDMATMQRVDDLTLDSGENFCNALHFAGGHLFAGLGTSPAKIVKINQFDMTKTATLTLESGENDCRAIVYNDIYLYAGLYTTPMKIVRVNIDAVSREEVLTLNTGENNCVALVYDDTYLYAAGSTYVVKILPNLPSGGGEIVYGNAGLSGSATMLSSSTRIRTDSADLLSTSLLSSRPSITTFGAAALNGVGNVVAYGLRLTVPSGTYMITKDDYYSKSQQAKYEKLVNHVEVYTNPLIPAAIAENVYSSSEVVTVAAGSTKTITITYSKKPVIEAVISLADAGANLSISNTATYAWGAMVSITNAGGTGQTCKISVSGKPLTVQGRELVTAKDDISIAEFGTMKYTFPDSPLVQTRAMAQKIADALLASAKDAKRDISLNWRGDPSLLLSDIIYAPEYQKGGIESWGNFYVTKQGLSFDGTLRATLEGRKIE